MLNKQRLLSGLITFFFSIFMVANSADAEESILEFEVNVDYSAVVKTHLSLNTDISKLERVSEIEVFYWYGCEACFQVDAALAEYLAINPSLKIRRTPLIARPEWRQQAYIQAMMEQLTEFDNSLSILDIYQQCLVDCSPFESTDDSIEWLLAKFQKGERPTINRDLLWTNEKMYRKRAELFSINQVPTIIINETYKIDANQAKSAGRMVKIVDYLLSQD